MNVKQLKLRDVLTLAFVLVLLAAVIYVWLSPAGVQPAPQLTVKNLRTGQTIDLAELRGRPVLVTFWATNCPGCIKEMPHLIELYEELHPRGLEIIGIAMSFDRPDHVLAMQENKQIPYPIVWDGEHKAAAAFGNVMLTPTSFLINPEGQIVKQSIGEMDMQILHAQILGMLQQQA